MAVEGLVIQAPPSAGLASDMTVRTNRVPNPSFETGTSGWSTGAFYHLNSGATISQGVPATAQSGQFVGGIACSGTNPAQGAFHSLSGQTFTAGVTYRLRVRVYQGAPSPVPLDLVLGRAAADHATTTVTNSWSGWSDVTVAWTPASTVTDAWCGIRTSLGSPAAATTIYVDGWLCEQGTLGTYFDGDSVGCRWSGTRGASTSTSVSGIDLNGSQWGLYDLSLGNPSKREELVSSTDSDGALPARIQKLENREVTFKLQLGNAASMDDALLKIAALESYLNKAEDVASQMVIDPGDYVRLIYTPADSTQSFFLPIMFGEITDVPKVVEGDDAGWFEKFPKVSVRCVCAPAGYGALRTYLDTTTSAAPAPSVTVAGGPGDLAPWVRTAVKDVATTSRGLVRLAVKRNESATTATILASAMTPVWGTYSAPNMTRSGTSTDWQVLATTPRQTRTGTFKVWAHRVTQPGGSTGTLRLTWGEAGGAVRKNTPVSGIDTALRDVYLGEVTANTSWDMWLESKGGVSLYALVIVPSDSFVELSTALPGEQMVGAQQIYDALQSTSTHISGRSFDAGSGTWSTTNAASPTWPVSSTNWARRSATSMVSPAFAQAGTGNYLDHDLLVTCRATNVPAATALDGFGAFYRFVDTSNYVRFTWNLQSNCFRLETVVAGTASTLWERTPTSFPSSWWTRFRFQSTSDGRWFVTGSLLDASTGKVHSSYTGSGLSPLLVSGSTLGNASSAKVGLWDYMGGVAPNRDWRDFTISSLVGITPNPIPSGGTLRLAGADMYGSDGQDYPYIGSGGLTFQPGVNNNLTVMAQRSSVGHASTSLADTPALDVDIEGYPRYLSVPHA